MNIFIKITSVFRGIIALLLLQMVVPGCSKTEHANLPGINDVFCPNCDAFPRTTDIRITEDVNTLFRIPNIVVAGEPNGMFSIFYDFVTATHVDVDIPLEAIKATITNNNDTLQHVATIDFDSTYSFLKIWDGMVDGAPYTGVFSYSIRLDFENGQYIDIKSKAIATTCEDVYRCAEEKDPAFDVTNCRYHQSFLWHAYGIVCP